MILDWVKKNQKLALKVTGVNFLLMALLLLFWAQPKEGGVHTENEKARANIARMEAQAGGTSKAQRKVNLMQKHKESQQVQLRVFLIIMIVAGAGFLAYGFLKKDP